MAEWGCELALELGEIRKIVSIGAPLACAGVVFSLVYITIGRIASDLGRAMQVDPPGLVVLGSFA